MAELPVNPNENGAAATPASSLSPPQPPKRRAPLRWLLWGVLGTVALVLLFAGAALTWVWTTEAGTRQVLSLVPGLQTTGLKGRVTGGAFAADTLTWRADGTEVVVTDLRWNDLSLRWRPHPGAWIGLTLQQPEARSVVVRTTPKPADPNAKPFELPADLKLPVVVDALGLQVGSVTIDEQVPITDIRADLHVGAEGGAVHRIDALALQRGPLRVAGTVSIGSAAELPLDAALEAVFGAGVGSSTPGSGNPEDWQAQVTAKGPLRQLDVNAKLQAVGDAAATVQARVTPLKAFPLASLNADLRDIDLSALAPDLPKTRLSGPAVLADTTAGQPLAVSLALTNSAAGPWDAKRLPVRGLRVAVQGRPEELDRLTFDALLLELGGEQPGGRVTGEGAWKGSDLQLTMKLDDLRPQRLDGRAPPMRIDGPITLAVKGLPVAAASGSASASAPVSSAAAAPSTAAAPQVPITGDFRVGLTGTLPDQAGKRALPKVAIDAKGSFQSSPNGALRLLLQSAAVKAGDATATASADARVAPSGQIQVQSKGELARFDPGVWLAEAVGRGKSELNGGWDADLTIPPALKTKPRQGAAAPAGLLPGLPPGMNGTVRVRLDPSRLSGLPLQGEATLTAAATAVDLLAAFQAGANSVKVDGRAAAGVAGKNGNKDGSGSSAVAGMQRWKLEVDAPVLADLAPLKSLLPASGPNQPAWFPKNGKLRLRATANGHWPELKSEGTLALADYTSPALAVGKADARWTFSGIEPNAPLALQATVIDVAQGQQRVERLQVSLDGTPRAHTLSIEASSPVRPPEWVEVAPTSSKGPVTPELIAPPVAAAASAPSPGSPTKASKGSTFSLQGNGGWRPERQGGEFRGGTWSGTLAQLMAAPRAAPGEPWLSARDIQLSVKLDADCAPVQALLQPNRIQAFGGALSWQQASWQPPVTEGALPRIALDAVLEPVRVAPWLERFQPQFGWAGELSLGGSFKIRSNRNFDADVVIERVGTGDLSLAIEGARRSLGLKQFKIALSAHDGLWEVTQAVDGTNIGVISGRQTVRSRADAMVPDAKAALQGSLGLVVPQLQVWAPWLPPGWRLAGKLQAGAVLSGTVGEPDYRGQVLGSEMAVRNLFEGVNLRDGELAVALTGTEATIEKFEFKGGGDGVLRVTGSARFGSAPKADLRVMADKFRALDRIDRRVSLSGAADVSFLQNSLSLKGKFTIDDGLIDITQSGAPSLDDDVVVYNLPGGPASTEPPKPQPKQRVKTKPEPGLQPAGTTAPPAAQPLTTDIRLAVDLGQSLRLRGRGLNTLLRGELVITTPGGELAVNGIVRAEEGTYTAYGQNLVVDRGRIFFTGEVGNPRLDILAVRPDIDIRVGVIVSGPAANPRVRLYSEPGLNEFDTLTWLVLGRAPEGLGRDDTALLQRAALAVLAGDKESGGGVINKLGLDELSVSNGTQGAVVSLGKQISKRVYVGYEKALAATGGTWQLIYRVAGRITVRARAGTDNAIDAIWTWRWD